MILWAQDFGLLFYISKGGDEGAHSCCLSLTRRGTLREKHEVNRERYVLGTFFSIQSEHCTSSVLVYLNTGMTLWNNFLVHSLSTFQPIALKAALPRLVARDEHKVSFHQVIAQTMLRTGSYVNSREWNVDSVPVSAKMLPIFSLQEKLGSTI